MALEPRSQVEAQGGREEIVGRAARAALLVLGVAGGLACGPSTPAEKAQADMATFRKEASTDNLVDRGKAFAAVGDTTRAEEYLSAALDQGANPKDVLPILLQVCVQTGRYRSAIQHAENQLRKHPDDVRTRFVLGTIYAAIGETKDAKSALETVVAARPDESRAHYALAVLARDSENDVIGADRHFREYLRIEPEGSHAEEARASLLKRMP
jgi:tetratricopeptide (TPR) repeat protein